MVQYKDLYGRTDPNNTGLKAGISTAIDPSTGLPTVVGTTPIGTVRTEQSGLTAEGVAATSQAKARRQQKQAIANDPGVKTTVNKDYYSPEKKGYQNRGGLWWKNGVYYELLADGTLRRATNQQIDAIGRDETDTTQTNAPTQNGQNFAGYQEDLATDKNLEKSQEQIEAEQMGQEYLTPEQKLAKDMEDLADKNKLEQKRLRIKAAEQAQLEAQKRSAAEAIANSMQRAGVESSSLNMLGAAARVQAEKSIADAQEKVDALRAEYNQAQAAAKEKMSAESAARVATSRAQLKLAEQERIDAAATAENTAREKAKADLALIAGSEDFNALSQEEQDAKIAAYSNIPEDIRNSIVSKARQAGMNDVAKLKNEKTTTASNVLSSAILNNVELTSGMMKELSSGSYLTTDEMAGFFLEAKSINENPNLTSDQKQEARKVLSDRIKGVAATKATSEMQDLMFYKQLLSKDPSLAEAFANKKGYTEDQKSSIKASVASAPAPHTSSVGISSSMVGSTYQINVPQGYDTSTSRVTGKEGKQCGEYVNDVTGVGVGNTLKSKTDLIDHHDPRVGDVFVQNIGPYGHVGIVTAINEDGTLQTSEFNRSGTDQERSDQASLDPSKIVGYIKNPYSKSAIDRANTNLDIGRILKSLSGSQVTDKERETMTNSVNAYINSGLTVDDALKRVIGYNISPEADKSYADFIYNRLSSLSKPPEGLNMSSFSSNLNNGNKLAAIRDLEKRIYKDSNDGVLLSNASRVEEKIEEARKLIDRGIAAVGAVEGSVAEWMGKFSSPETNALKTALTNVFNEFTKANLGSAMTETEWNIYSGMIPQISDTQESLSNKLDTFEDNAVRKLNLYRIENNLPEVTREILLDQTKLTDAYDKMFREQKEKSTPKFVPGGYTITQGYVLNPPPANPSQYQSPAPTSK